MGKLALPCKVQLVFLRPANVCKYLRNPPQKTPAVTEPLRLDIRQHPQANQFFDVRGAKLPLANPKRGMNVAQPPGEVLMLAPL